MQSDIYKDADKIEIIFVSEILQRHGGSVNDCARGFVSPHDINRYRNRRHDIKPINESII